MSDSNRKVTIGGLTFDRVRYDADADVLYLHIGDPSSAVDFDESPEGHHLRFDAEGRVVGVTLVGVRRDLEEGRTLSVTVPELIKVDPSVIRDALAAA